MPPFRRHYFSATRRVSRRISNLRYADIMKISRVYLGLLMLVLGSLIVIPGLANHDAQRAGQILVFVMAFIYFMSGSRTHGVFPVLGSTPKLILLGLFGLGVLSCLLGDTPGWSFVELAVAAASCVLSATLVQARRGDESWFGSATVIFVAALVSLKILQYSAALLAAYGAAPGQLDTDMLLLGFSNKRFYGQFQTMTLPLLAWPLLTISMRPQWRGLAMALLCLWWLVAWSGGTRGTWLGMAVAVGVLALCGPLARRWVGWQIIGAGVGGGLFWLLISYFPPRLGLDVVNFAGERLNGNLAGRGPLWEQAWMMIITRPLTGYGPMGFANLPNPTAAHPHQAILQWGSEWGIPSLLAVCVLVVWGLGALMVRVQRESATFHPVAAARLCLFAAAVGALTQSMVDGVIVIPYSQLWLTIIAGCLLTLQPAKPARSIAAVDVLWRAGSFFAALLLVTVAVRDFSNQQTRDAAFFEHQGGHFQPRFWSQGIIAFDSP